MTAVSRRIQGIGELLDPVYHFVTQSKYARRSGERWGRPIYLISDEAYRGIGFDDRAFHSPAPSYRYTFVVYTYGTTLPSRGSASGLGVSRWVLSTPRYNDHAA